MQSAVSGGQRMQAALVRHLLDFSRIDSRPLQFEPVDTTAVFAEVMDLLQARVDESDGEVTHAELSTVLADRMHLVRLLLNLIGKAIKYRRSDAPPRVRIEATHAEGQWLFAVRDNGLGIPLGNQQRVFDVFTRLHTHEYQGTGLGLAICKRIVERHGGRIWVDSEPGTGSVFRFSLPMM